MNEHECHASVAEVVVALLERCNIGHAFGVISIHNMPILDAIGRRQTEAQAGSIRFVTARSEQGAVNMADAYARVRGGFGVALSSTGTAAGNTCGAMVEALTAGTPLLHLTGQIETAYLDQQFGTIHEARDQLGMLAAVSKAAYRAATPDQAVDTVKQAIQCALTAPTGPVSVEIPIDVQAAPVAWPDDLEPLPVPGLPAAAASLDALADALVRARRPLLWLGGGARGAPDAVHALVDLGFGVVSSVQGRGIVAEDHPLTLGAFHLHPPVERFYGTCDAMLVVGSHLRSNETLGYQLKLPRPLLRIDADAGKRSHAYPLDQFVHADARVAIEGLVARLTGRMRIDPALAADLAQARHDAEAAVRAGLGPYALLVDTLQEVAGRSFVWVRDITISNSTWGNRSLRLRGPRDGVHAAGGGIGQGLQMALGAALAADGRKTLCLAGDGGFMVNVGELATLVEAGADVTIVLMNDRGYGVIRNIQDAHYGGRRYFADLHTPDFALLARAVGLPYFRVGASADFPRVVGEAVAVPGPSLVEIDMLAVGPFATTFAGPPARSRT